ncbi:uncharacterized protein LOC119324429 isoform X1 [Triticum dicoccoides]|uniref:uncharacterized protein LOC119324429 isoform X1 n=1 Tax=Triticum dicoccoides TaxID=85692 RepID=UPI000E78E39A|nr:uncharacterized protein LOC119324429 isoform X1 [Triticum dicoccoides]
MNPQWTIPWPLGSHFPISSLQPQSTCVSLLVQQLGDNGSLLSKVAFPTTNMVFLPGDSTVQLRQSPSGKLAHAKCGSDYMVSTRSMAQFQYRSSSVLLIFEQFDWQIAWLPFPRAGFLMFGRFSRACTLQRPFLLSPTIWNFTVLGSSWGTRIVTCHLLLFPWDPCNNLQFVGMSHLVTSRATFCMLLLLPWDPGNDTCCSLDGATLRWRIAWDLGDLPVLIDALRILQYLVVQQTVLISGDLGDMVLVLVQFVAHSWCFLSLLLPDPLRYGISITKLNKVWDLGSLGLQPSEVIFFMRLMMPWNFRSPATYGWHAMNSSPEDGPQAIIVGRQFSYGLLSLDDLYLFQDHYCKSPCYTSEAFKSEGVQGNEHCAVKLVLPALSSCEQWDPGGLNFANVQGMQVPALLGLLIALCICSGWCLQGNTPMKSAEKRHRLGGKPIVKGEGMSASLLPCAGYGLGPATLPSEEQLQLQLLKIAGPKRWTRYPRRITNPAAAALCSSFTSVPLPLPFLL